MRGSAEVPRRPSASAARSRGRPRGRAQARGQAASPGEEERAPGHVHIQASFNNTIITITDQAGAVISWGSAGVAGFKGSRKSTPYAAALSAEGAARRAMEHG